MEKTGHTLYIGVLNIKNTIFIINVHNKTSRAGVLILFMNNISFIGNLILLIRIIHNNIATGTFLLSAILLKSRILFIRKRYTSRAGCLLLLSILIRDVFLIYELLL